MRRESRGRVHDSTRPRAHKGALLPQFCPNSSSPPFSIVRSSKNPSQHSPSYDPFYRLNFNPETESSQAARGPTFACEPSTPSKFWKSAGPGCRTCCSSDAPAALMPAPYFLQRRRRLPRFHLGRRSRGTRWGGDALLARAYRTVLDRLQAAYPDLHVFCFWDDTSLVGPANLVARAIR